MVAEFVIAFEFIESTNLLAGNEIKLIWKAVQKFNTDPSWPSLQLERLDGKAKRNRYWSIRASKELRILLARVGSLSVFLRAGHHDPIYNLANRTDYVVPVRGAPGLIGLSQTSIDFSDPAPRPAPLDPLAPRQKQGPSILEHWSTTDLQNEAFDEEEIVKLREATAETLLDVWPDIDDETFSLVFELSETTPERRAEQQLLEDAEAAEARFREAIVKRGALAGLSTVLSGAEIDRLVAAPIEDWMIFLHPDQRALVDRSFNGPARVRGSAGTGKTVVALHRAAALANQLEKSPVESSLPILFTTFVKHLPPVFENLYRRLPAAPAAGVEFINVHKLAGRVCRGAGLPPKIDTAIANSTFAKARAEVVRPGTPLAKARLTHRYLREEVTAVIKGRGVDTVDEYLAMERTGRRTPFTAAMRRQAWELRENWDRRLASVGVSDFLDVVRQARDVARCAPAPMYSAAVIDESQDLSLVGLQLIRALVNGPGGDRANGLFLVGDGAQKIYAGGFTLAQAGIDIRGNSAVLRVNYRNTRPIIETAMACTGSETVDDLGDEYDRGDAAAMALRDGSSPVLVTAGDLQQQIAFVATEIKKLVALREVGPGDIAVCAAVNQTVKKAIAQLKSEGVACQNMDQFVGRPNERVKIGTFHRAKGLEFKVVFILDISEGSFPSRQLGFQSDEEYVDQRSLQISQLFVAMTRARDRLFVVCDTHPSPVIGAALDRFTIVEA